MRKGVECAASLPPELAQIAKVTEIRLAEAEFASAAARCLNQLVDISAEMEATSKAKIDVAVDLCMKGLAKDKETTGAESQPKATGTTSTAQPVGADESSTPEADEAEHTQTTSVSGGEGASAPATTSKGDAPALATTSANEDSTSDSKQQSHSPSGHVQAIVDKQPKAATAQSSVISSNVSKSDTVKTFLRVGRHRQTKISGECHRR